MALAEARSGSVLWVAVGPQAAGFGSSVLREVPNLTLQQRLISTAADSKATLQEVLWLVRQQTYTMVVLDGVAGLAPPPACSVAWGASPPAVAASGAAGAAAGAGPAGPAPAVPATATCTAAAADLLEKLGAAVAMRAAGVRGAARGLSAASGFGLWPHAAATLDSGATGPINLKFLHNVLPVLLEETLSELAVSCGPELRTTTLVLNPYTWRERDQATWGASGSAAGGVSGRSRYARRAILRHAAATLHVLPEAAGPAAGTAAGVRGPIRGLRAVLSRGGPSGEDGEALRTWSLITPVRLAHLSPG